METEQNPRGMQMFKIWWAFFGRWSLCFVLTMLAILIVTDILQSVTGVRIHKLATNNFMIFALGCWVYYLVFRQLMGRRIAAFQLSLFYDGPESQITESELVEKADRKFFARLTWAFMVAFRQLLKRKIGELQLSLFKLEDQSDAY
jgi:hypothetical protein